MPVVSAKKPSFAAGELSPLVYGRHDLDKYASGLARCENYVIRPQGAATRRPPTEWIDNAYASSIFVPFEFSRADSYIVELGDLKARFFRDGGVLEDAPGHVYEIVTPYAAADLAGIRHINSGDVIYLLHPTRGPRKLARFGDLNWQVLPLTLKGGPFLDLNIDTGKTLKASSGALGATVTLTAGGWTFNVGHVGALFQLGFGDTAGLVRVTATTGGATATGVVEKAVPAASVHPSTSDIWSEGAFSGLRGWPEVACFHQQRLWLGKGNFLYASAASDFETFDVTGDPGGALAERIGSGTQRNNDTVWFSSGKIMAVGTSGEEFTAQGGSLNEGITATSFKIPPATTEGSLAADPVRVSSEVLHVNKSGRQLRRFIYDYQIDDFRSDDLTIAAEHMTSPGVKKIAWQRDPLRVLWLLLKNGELRGFTYNREQEVVAWHRHPIAGIVDDIAVIPSSDGTYDELWLIVRRAIAGTGRRYVERMRRYFDHETDLDPAVVPYLDCQLTGGPFLETITGLDFLEGETVSMVADGSASAGIVVEFGRIELDKPVTRVTVGLPYRSRLRLLPAEADLNDGGTDGRKRAVKGLAIRLHGGPGGLVGDLDDFDRMETLRHADLNVMGEAPRLYKGLVEIAQNDGWKAEDFVDIVIDEPFANDILSATRIVDFAEA